MLPKLRLGAAGFAAGAAPPRLPKGDAEPAVLLAPPNTLGFAEPPSAPNGEVVPVSLERPELAKAEEDVVVGAVSAFLGEASPAA